MQASGLSKIKPVMTKYTFKYKFLMGCCKDRELAKWKDRYKIFKYAITDVCNITIFMSFACMVLSLSYGIPTSFNVSSEVFTQLMDFVPGRLFIGYYISSACGQLLCAVAILAFRSVRSIALTSVLRAIIIFIGVYTVYFTNERREYEVSEIANNWGTARYEMVVSAAKKKLDCCGWNQTTSTCYEKKCAGRVFDEIRRISQAFTKCCFYLNFAQLIVLVFTILVISMKMVKPVTRRKEE